MRDAYFLFNFFGCNIDLPVGQSILIRPWRVSQSESFNLPFVFFFRLLSHWLTTIYLCHRGEDFVSRCSLVTVVQTFLLWLLVSCTKPKCYWRPNTWYNMVPVKPTYSSNVTGTHTEFTMCFVYTCPIAIDRQPEKRMFNRLLFDWTLFTYSRRRLVVPKSNEPIYIKW